MRILLLVCGVGLSAWATVQIFGDESADPGPPTLGFRELRPISPGVMQTAAQVPAPPVAATPRVLPSEVGVLPRVTVRHDIGDGVGYDHGFTYLEGFVPLWQAIDRGVLFGNVRVVNFDDAGLWEFNAGGGFRWINAFTDRINGVNVFYDGRRTRQTFFDQVGIGAESLGPFVDLRANFYIPVGNARQRIADTGLFNPQFVASNIAFDRTQAFDVAMGGFEFEAGGGLPAFARIDLRGYLGYYHYDADGMPNVDGIRGRLEAMLTRNVSLHFAAQHDRVFDTTVSGGVALHWGGSRLGNGVRTRSEALGQRVVRDVNVVLARDVQATKELAIDPTTGQPIVVKHASSNAPAGGDGTVERPYQTLTELQAGSAPGNLLFAHAGSVFAGQGIRLQTGQRFLGEGIDHQLATTRGTILLPRATTNSGLPTIADAPGRAIILASNTEVAGIIISNPAGAGIFGKEISNVNLNRNIIVGPDRSGIRFVDVSGQVYIGYNQIRNGDGHGINMVNQNSTNTSVQIVNNTFTNIAPCGCFDPIHIVARDSATWNGLIAGNIIDQAGGNGISLAFKDQTAGNVLITRNTLTNVGQAEAHGIHVDASDDAVASASITRNTLDTIGVVGILLERRHSATARYQVAYNTLDNIGIIGLFADSTNKKSIMMMQVVGNTSSSSFFLNAASKSSNFLFENDLGSNTFTGGASLSSSAEVVIVPAGTLGFPQP